MRSGVKKEEEEKKEEEKKSVPKDNIEKILKSLNLSESISKLKETQIDDPEIFFSLTDDKLIELLEIKTEGKKYRFKEKMKQVKEKHEKEEAMKDKEEISEIIEEKLMML